MSVPFVSHPGISGTFGRMESAPDLSDLTLCMRSLTGSPWIAYFLCWTFPEVAILGESQKERGSGNGNSSIPAWSEWNVIKNVHVICWQKIVKSLKSYIWPATINYSSGLIRQEVKKGLINWSIIDSYGYKFQFLLVSDILEQWIIAGSWGGFVDSLGGKIFRHFLSTTGWTEKGRECLIIV